MAQAGIAAESRNAYEAIMLEVNQSIEKIIPELLVAPSVGDILGNRGEIPGGYVFANPFAHPDLAQLFHTPPVGETTNEQTT
jgi:hypothetical protein